MLTQSDFLAAIELYLRATGMSATSFGEETVNDPNFVFDLREGRSPNLAIVGRVDKFMKNNPPIPAPSRPRRKEKAA